MSLEHNLFQEITRRLRATRMKETRIQVTNGLFRTGTVSLAVGLGITSLEALGNFSIPVRTVLVGAWAGATVAALTVFAGKPLLRLLGIVKPQSDDEIAIRVGKKFPDFEDKIVNALQLFRTANQQVGASSDLALASFTSIGKRAQSLDFDAIIDKEDSKKAAIFLLSALGISVLSFGVFGSTMNPALTRLVHFNRAFLPPAPFNLVIAPRAETILSGQTARITVIANGIPPDVVSLRIREEQQQDFDKYDLRGFDSAGKRYFMFEIPSLKKSVEYYAETPWFTDSIRTEVGKITVTNRPELRTLSGVVTYPSYTKLPTSSLTEQNADVVALRGSRVSLSINTSKSIVSAEIVQIRKSTAASSTQSSTEENSVGTDETKGSKNTNERSGDTVITIMNVKDRSASGIFTVSFSGEYYIRVKDASGETNVNPLRYQITATNDVAPTISLTDPTSEVRLSENALLPMQIVISDDYGFSGLKLWYRLLESKYSKPQQTYSYITLPFPSTERAAEFPYLWDVKNIGISPEDKIEFYLEVFDNDIVTGPKSAKTAPLTAKLPSLDEVFKEADKTQEVAAKELEKVLKDAQEIKKATEELQRELRKDAQKEKLDWKEKKKIEDLTKKQTELQQKVENVQKQLEQMTEQLQNNQAISPETLQKYQQLQELMKKVNAPELRQQAMQMQQALQQMSPEQMQQAMKNFQFNEEQFRKNIERTMKILQRVQAEQKTDELAKRAKELEDKQNDLQKQMQNANPNDKKKMQELADKQQQLKDDLARMEQEAKELENLMKQIGDDTQKDDMKDALADLNKQETDQNMDEASQDMKSGDQQKAAQKQQKAAQNMKKFGQKMREMKQKMEQKGKQEAMRQMRRSIQDLNKLSKKQEELKDKSKTLDPNSAQFRENAQNQADALGDLNNIFGQLSALAQKSFSVTPEMGKELGDAMNSMQNAMDQLGNRNSFGAAQQQQSSMGSLNRAMMQMQSALSKMQGQSGNGSCENPGGEGEGSSGSGGQQGFMQRLQQQAMQQQMLNQQMQQMMKQGQGGQQGKFSPEQQAQLQRLAGQQGKIQKAMEELAKEEKNSGGAKKAMGNLEKIAQEMQEIVSDMRGTQLSEETLKRQEKILSRMLDASRSARERDFEKERESTAGGAIKRNSPKELDLSTIEGKKKAADELLRSLQQGYSKDYEALIRKYFETLQKTNVKM